MDTKIAAQGCRKYLAKCSDMPLHGDDATSIGHIAEMLDSIENGTVSGEKAHRWLAWAQAVICCRGGATLDELKQVNFQA